MTLREIVAVMVGFLKKSADTTPKNTVEPIKQAAQKPVEKVATPAETVVLPAEEKTAPPPKHTAESLAPTQKTVTSENKPPIAQESSSATSENLPQDSMLRRHYLTHLRSLTEATLSSQSPIAVEEKEASTITAVSASIEAVVQTTETAPTATVISTPAKVSKIPEDSMLKRHYLTQIHTQIAASLPIRPTDSMLRRHYDTLLENEVKKQLNCQN